MFVLIVVAVSIVIDFALMTFILRSRQNCSKPHIPSDLEERMDGWEAGYKKGFMEGRGSRPTCKRCRQYLSPDDLKN